MTCRCFFRREKAKGCRILIGQEIVRGKKSIKVREFYFESEKIDILKESQRKLKYNIAGRNISGFCDLNDDFS